MMLFTKHKCSWLILLAGIFIISCNEVNDPQPPDLETIPDKVVDLLERNFPGAEQTTIRVVEKNQLWEADYSQNAEHFYVAVDSASVLAAYKLIGPNPPDSIAAAVSKLAIRGGTLSDFRENLSAYAGEATYRLHGTDYLLSWKPSQPFLEMELHSKFSYVISSSAQLPVNARTFMAAQGWEFSRATCFVNKSNIRQFKVEAKNILSNPITLFFDSSGSLIFTSYGAQKLYLNKKDLPAQLVNYMDKNPLLQGFTFVSGALNQHYMVYLKKGSETFHILLDERAGLVHLLYNGPVAP